VSIIAFVSVSISNIPGEGLRGLASISSRTGPSRYLFLFLSFCGDSVADNSTQPLMTQLKDENGHGEIVSDLPPFMYYRPTFPRLRTW
jgi:hypothetical protein